ncbi:MAG: NUDIX domain-containing protein [Campylobacterota bacterium]|nr:NUDIX domain-containing protein [Campylobacterota bacterium]
MYNDLSVFIDDSLFRDIIDHTPLVSLDLVVKKDGKVLLGQRCNRPAKGYWFTIGGRILKNEKIRDTIHRIARDELGTELTNAAEFVGLFEHFYDDGIYEGVSTHYVNLVYEAEVDDLPALPDDQHDTYRWFGIDELLESENVHQYIKDIFK